MLISRDKLISRNEEGFKKLYHAILFAYHSIGFLDCMSVKRVGRGLWWNSSIAKHLLDNFSQNSTDGVQIARMLQLLSFIKNK